MARKYSNHGATRGGKSTPEYTAWTSMMGRCNNPNNQDYHYYGGRGIKVCKRWSDYSLFLEDMGNKTTTNHTLDRIDNNKGYSPENCRWATLYQQQNNTRKSTELEYRGVILSHSQWASIVGISSSCLYSRLKKGWPIHKALFEPIVPLKGNGMFGREELLRYLSDGKERSAEDMKENTNTVNPRRMVSTLRKAGCHILCMKRRGATNPSQSSTYTLLSFPDGLYGVGL